MPEKTQDITALLEEWRGGDKTALDRLIPLVHAELRTLSRHYLRRERRDHILQATALVNEAYLRLVKQDRSQFANRAYFFAAASRVMRQILVDYARTRCRAKRGGTAQKVSLESGAAVSSENLELILAVEEALNRLAAWDERKAQVIEMRFFGGLDVEDTASVLHVSRNTVIRDWSLAKAWLRRELGDRSE